MSIETSLNFRRISDTVTTSGSVAEADLLGLAAAGYDVVIDLLPHDSSYAVASEETIVTDQGVGYVYIPVDFAAPTAADLEAFSEAMDRNAGKKVHVHCAANYRVSAFYSLYALSKGQWSAEQVDEHIAEIWNPADHAPWEAFIRDARQSQRG